MTHNEERDAARTLAPIAMPIPIDQLVLEVYDSAQTNVRSKMLTRLVGKVYEAAPPATQRKLLQHLLQPLGLLSVAVVANGIFGRMLSRGNWVAENIRLEDVQAVDATDVVALADYVMQVSHESIQGLARLLSSSPVLATSAAATVLVTLLLRHASNRRHGDTPAKHNPTNTSAQ